MAQDVDEPYDPTLAKLRELLSDPRLLPTDRLTVNTVGNLIIYRDNKYIGYVDIGLHKSVKIFGDHQDYVDER